MIGLFACITLTVMGVILGASKMWYNSRIIWRPMNGIGVVTAIGYSGFVPDAYGAGDLDGVPVWS